jgi:hypothetical protein
VVHDDHHDLLLLLLSLIVVVLNELFSQVGGDIASKQRDEKVEPYINILTESYVCM